MDSSYLKDLSSERNMNLLRRKWFLTKRTKLYRCIFTEKQDYKKCFHLLFIDFQSENIKYSWNCFPTIGKLNWEGIQLKRENFLTLSSVKKCVAAWWLTQEINIQFNFVATIITLLIQFRYLRSWIYQDDFHQSIRSIWIKWVGFLS